MINLFKYEILRIFKKKNTKILISILILCEIGMLLVMQNLSKGEAVFSSTNVWEPMYNYFDTSKAPLHEAEDIKSNDDRVMEQVDLFRFYETKKDWKNMYLSAMQYSQYSAQIHSYYTNVLPNVLPSYFFRHKDRIEKIGKEFDFYSIEEYSDYLYPTTFGSPTILFQWPQHDLQYFYLLYKQNLAPMTYSHIDSTTAFIQLLRNLLAIILPFLITVLFFTDRNDYSVMGIDKTMMTIPHVRKKFTIVKLMVNICVVMIIVFFPILIFTILLGAFDHFKNMNYPLLANIDGITQFKFSDISNLMTFHSMKQCIDTNSVMNYGLAYTSNNMQVNPALDFIPIWQGILLIIPLEILLIGFYVQITFLCNRLFKNLYVALFINIGILLLLLYLSPFYTTDFFNIFNPLTYRDPGLNVIGTSYYPWSLGICVLLLYNISLYFINRTIFKRKYYN